MTKLLDAKALLSFHLHVIVMSFCCCVRLIVENVAGNGTDVHARVVADTDIVMPQGL